jgi:UDP-N-acetylmuramate dehydrogenase
MIEHCGLKGYRAGDAAVSERHALVLVNHGQASGAEILSLADRVRETVAGAFGIRLETEPRIIRFE